MSLMLSIGVLGGGKNFNPWIHCGVRRARTWCTFPFWPSTPSVLCTYSSYHQIPHFSLSHSRPFSGLLFYQLNLALTGTEGFFDPTLALSSIYLLSRLDRKRKTPNPEPPSYLHMIGITTYIIRPFSAHDAKIFFHSYESEWRI